jgi:hypothetical protein
VEEQQQKKELLVVQRKNRNMSRQPMKQVSIGGTGAGKTWDNMKFIKEVYSNPKNPNARKCSIYDVNEEHPDIKAIQPKDIPAFVKQQTIEIRRVIPRDAKTGRELGLNEKFELLSDIINNYMFRNGLLYLEDINNYTIGVQSTELINLLTTNRHKLLDIFISLQTFRSLPPRLWGNVNVLKIHKTNDTPFQSKIRDQIEGHMEVLRIANIMVSDKVMFNERFFVTLNMGTKKLTGEYSLDDFVQASEKYLSLNQIMVKNYSKMNKVSIEEARKRKVGEFIFKYNGNVKLKKPE